MSACWIHIRPYYVGNPERGYGMGHESDLIEDPTREAAWKRGCRVFEHDDFWLATFDGTRITALYHGPKGPKRRSVVELRAANAEFGFPTEER
jgi:hypothetical protein